MTSNTYFSLRVEHSLIGNKHKNINLEEITITAKLYRILINNKIKQATHKHLLHNIKFCKHQLLINYEYTY